MRLRERTGDLVSVIDCLRAASGSVRTAINRLGEMAREGESAQLVREAREQLVAAMHLIDGVGMGLQRSGR
jgi:hypothetical protein